MIQARKGVVSKFVTVQKTTRYDRSCGEEHLIQVLLKSLPRVATAVVSHGADSLLEVILRYRRKILLELFVCYLAILVSIHQFCFNDSL